MSGKNINLDHVVSKIVNLSKVDGKLKNTHLRGEKIVLDWGGDWVIDPKKMYMIEELPKRVTLEIDSSVGQFLIENAFWTSSNPIEGTGNCLRYISTFKPQDEIVYRCLVSIDTNDFLMRVHLPSRAKCNSTNSIVSFIGLKYWSKNVDVYVAANNNYLVFESTDIFKDIKEFYEFINVTRMFLSFFWGYPLDTNSVLTRSNKGNGDVLEAVWYNGVRFPIEMPYSAVPTTSFYWKEAENDLKVTYSHNVNDSAILSKCLDSIYRDKNLTATMEYLRISNVQPVHARGVTVSVALENLCHIISKDKSIKLGRTKKPLEKDLWSKWIRPAMIDVLDKCFKKSLVKKLLNLISEQGWEEEAYKVIKARIEGFNNPTNFRKLIKPFEYFNITLSESDQDAIHKRNKFLHEGPLTDFDDDSLDDDNWKVTYYIELTIYTLVCHLLLKYIGYSGIMFDWGSKDLKSSKMKYINV